MIEKFCNICQRPAIPGHKVTEVFVEIEFKEKFRASLYVGSTNSNEYSPDLCFECLLEIAGEIKAKVKSLNGREVINV